MLTDSHAHISSADYQDIERVINEAKKNDVLKIINSATNLSTCIEVIELSRSYQCLFFSLGIHPEFCDSDYSFLEPLIKENIRNKNMVGIGEIGLDYHYGKENKDQQIHLFEYQLSLAEKYNLPVIIHSREATLDTINCLKKYNVKGVIHCFTGSIETAKEYINMGFYVGIGGVVTFKNASLKETLKDIPIEKIVLETDSPYLTPEPFRKYQNEPKYVKTVAEYVANIYEISLTKLEEIINKNIKDIFDI